MFYPDLREDLFELINIFQIESFSTTKSSILRSSTAVIPSSFFCDRDIRSHFSPGNTFLEGNVQL